MVKAGIISFYFLFIPERLVAVQAEFDGGGPDFCLRGFRAGAVYLLTGLNRLLPLLSIHLAGFIVLRHDCASLRFDLFWGRPA
jgi:hypothetical protein